MNRTRIASFFTSVVMFAAAVIPGFSSGQEAYAAESMRDISTMELVRDMGIGINLGNTLEACGDWIDGKDSASYETAWGSPVITREMIQGYRDAGFGVLRIPVAWSNLMKDDGNYNISSEYMDRVTEVIDWTLDSGLYAIVNIHWDNGWVNTFPENKTECMKRYEKMWTQIADRYRDYGDYLMFESQNEELGWEKLWNRWAGDAGKTESYALANEINQKFVDVVRKSGGNNEKRHLLISGYNTGIDVTCDPLFKMPSDPAERCAVSVHYYSPSTFAILEEDADWGKAQSTWGTAKEVQDLNNEMDMMKNTFVDRGIPVIIGEYGCPEKNKEPESVMKFLTSVCEAAYSRQMCPVLWDTPGGRYDRIECKMESRELNEKLVAIAGSSIKEPGSDGSETVTYTIDELKKTAKGDYIIPLGKNAKNLTKAVISLKCTSSENSGWFCGGGGLTFDSVKTSDGKSMWSSKGFNYDGGKDKVLITFDGKFADDEGTEYDAVISCTEAVLTDWWHSSEKYPEGGDDVKCEFLGITLYFSAGSEASEPETPASPEAPEKQEIVKGDVDCNGTVNAADLTKAVEAVINITELKDAELKNADMNDDGRLSILDIIVLKNKLAA
ncbi:MAG: cellulase family glycosylhydrolase [Oscillospiraceae bacterium]|nr:cellulase family glycosylhydrolase [Oscillospiraceae bacterium]